MHQMSGRSILCHSDLWCPLFSLPYLTLDLLIILRRKQPTCCYRAHWFSIRLATSTDALEHCCCDSSGRFHVALCLFESCKHLISDSLKLELAIRPTETKRKRGGTGLHKLPQAFNPNLR